MGKTKHTYYNLNNNFVLFEQKATKNNNFFNLLIKKVKKENTKILNYNPAQKTLKILFNNKVENWKILKIVFSGIKKTWNKLRLQIPPQDSQFDRILGIHEESKLYFLISGFISNNVKTISSFWIPMWYFLYFRDKGSFKYEHITKIRQVKVYVNQDFVQFFKNPVLEKDIIDLDKKQKNFYLEELENTKNTLFKTNKNPKNEIQVNLTGEGEYGISKSSFRKHQTKFRKNAIARYKNCFITGIKEKNLLIAGHIKPDNISSPKEKVDPKNSYLLSPLFDKLIDAGLITFQNNGKIRFSSSLSKKTKTIITKQINNPDYYLIVSDKISKKYLKYHRTKIFKK